ncbi:hypothetical protein ARMGADRAFT_1123373 [Armillaria gallica]|uniref:Uncharacterized protein n=1 Tax=Armillaria gallica TaxID=47427 RepID=A0A2H3DCU4_ARMGA|nr:hypothetical protein ARMGADRAFT_1123373 [Armillaria gallica]
MTRVVEEKIRIPPIYGFIFKFRSQVQTRLIAWVITGDIRADVLLGRKATFCSYRATLERFMQRLVLTRVDFRIVTILFLKKSGATHAQFIVQADQDMSSLRKVFASGSIDRNLDRPSIRVDKDICLDDVLDAMLARARGDDKDTPRRYNSNFEQLIGLMNTWVRYLLWPCEK